MASRYCQQRRQSIDRGLKDINCKTSNLKGFDTMEVKFRLLMPKVTSFCLICPFRRRKAVGLLLGQARVSQRGGCGQVHPAYAKYLPFAHRTAASTSQRIVSIADSASWACLDPRVQGTANHYFVSNPQHIDSFNVNPLHPYEWTTNASRRPRAPQPIMRSGPRKGAACRR